MSVRRLFWYCMMSGCSAAAVASAPALAQDVATNMDARSSIGEIVVTAQKREQNLQSVPVAVTALAADDLVANRIESVRDLNAIAPNLTIRVQPGGLSNPSYTMRGIVSGATAPGADKGVAVYLDGVYLGSTLGSVIEFADIERIEVLKGPQGTLFGRNSTGGAISFVTRDPSGEFGIRQDITLGNKANLRLKTRVDSPQFGPLSLSATYAHSERRGDIRNTGAGTAWDFSAATDGKWGTRVSPRYLGSGNTEAVSAAAKLELSPSFTATYKFDWSETDFTADAHAPLYTNFAALGPQLGGLLNAIYANQPSPGIVTPLVTERPSAVNNWFTTPGRQRISGHNLNLHWQATDHLSVRNILSTRSTKVGSTTQLDSLGGLVNVIPAAGGVGEPYLILGTRSDYKARQWTNEMQINFDSDLINATAGYLHYDDDIELTSDGLNFSVLTDFTFPDRNTKANLVRVKSDAVFLQVEAHVLPGLDLVGGARQTWDRKNGVDNTIRTAPTAYSLKDDKLTWAAGINFQATDNLFAYAKYSTGYISGGYLATLAYKPETAKSWEAGIKAEWLDRRLRTNLSVFDVKYKNMHFITSGITAGVPSAPQVLINGGDSHARGFEFEGTAVPVSGLTLKANAGYTHFKYTAVNPILSSVPTYRPEWTGNLSAQYETDPVFRGGHLLFRLDGNYQSSFETAAVALPAQFRSLTHVDASWIVNGRIALADMDLSGAKTQIALWGRNLTNNNSIAYATAQAFLGTATFERARTYGVDISVDF